MKRTLFASIALAAAASLAAFAPSAMAADAPSPPAASATPAAPAQPTTPANTPTPPAAPAPATKTVRARVLTDCEHGKANDVVTLPVDVAKDGEKGGTLDTTKAAVDYAAGLPQNKPKPAES